MDEVSASQPQDRGFESQTGHDHGSSPGLVGFESDLNNLWNFFHNRAKINKFKLTKQNKWNAHSICDILNINFHMKKLYRIILNS